MYNFLAQPWVRWACKIQFVLAVCIYLGLLLIKSPPVSNVDLSDSTLHFVGNFLLFSSAWVAFGNNYTSIKILLLCIPFALAGEFAQHLVAERTVDPKDVMANLLGLFLAFAVCSNLKRIFRP